MSDTALVPLPPDPSVIEQAADPGQYVVLACERAKAWLTDALEHGDIDRIVELKSQAEAIRVYTAQKQIGKDAELSAAEIVRRAERGIGVAIRRGQEEGTIAKRGSIGAYGGPDGRPRGDDQVRPSDIVPEAELRHAAYPLADDISDDEFEEVLAEAKEEENLSRSNVLRKLDKAKAKHPVEPTNPRSLAAVAARKEKVREMAANAYTSRQIAETIGVSVSRVTEICKELNIDVPADAVVGKTRRLDATRIVTDTVISLEATVMSLGLVDFDDLDLADLDEWVTSLSSSLSSLNKFHKQLKEMTRDEA